MIARPRVSVFTPSHNPQYLDELYESLAAQTFKDFEWIALLNNGAQWKAPVKSGWVKVIHTSTVPSVGALKREAVGWCRGEILVEADHDDLLHEDCLKRVVATFKDHPEVSLVYSDFAQINADGSPNHERFNPAMGWTYDELNAGRACDDLKCNSMEPTPHNVCHIWYAPNHVRAFTRAAYDAAGGYNADLKVLDDQDLMARLYQQGPFLRIPELLYFQRFHGANTQSDQETNESIQFGTIAMYDQTIESCSLAWAKRRGLRAIDLGAAHGKPEGYEGIDRHGSDHVGDIFVVLATLDDSSVGVVRAHDFLEHVKDKVRLMNELYRVLTPGGMLLTHTPSTDGRGAFQDPTHVSFWNENSFWYYTSPQHARYIPEITCKFQVSAMETVYPSDWHRKHGILYVNANLIAIKDGTPRNGGELHW